MELQKKMVAIRSQEPPRMTASELRRSCQRSREKICDCETVGAASAVVDAMRLPRSAARFRLAVRLGGVFGKFQEHLFQRPGQRSLPPQLFERTARDQPAVLHDADPAG